MKVSETNIEGLYIIDGLKFDDQRGSLIKPYVKKYLSEFNLELDFHETWFTKSQKNVIRAMHLQVGEMACEKFVSVINGCVIDVVLDLRNNSSTYGKYFEIRLSANDPLSLYIPKGCAHGYRVMEDQTITLYKATKYHSAIHDQGIKWNSFGYDWGIENPIMSDRDKNLEEFQNQAF